MGIFSAYHIIILVLALYLGVLILCLKILVFIFRPLKRRIDAWLVVKNRESKEGLAKSRRHIKILERLKEEKKDWTRKELDDLLSGKYNLDDHCLPKRQQRFHKVRKRRVSQ